MSSVLFAFDELDEIQDAPPPSKVQPALECSGWREEKGHRCKMLSGSVDVVSGLTGDVVCEAFLRDAVRVSDIKAAIALELDIPAELQQLLGSGGRRLQDEALISRVLSEERPKVSLIVSCGECLALIEEGRLDLQGAPPQLRGLREAVLAAVRKDGSQLEFASPELQADREVVLAALAAGPQATPGGGAAVVGSPLRFASEVLKGDREVVLAAVLASGWALEHATEELRSDFEIVEVAVRQTGAALGFAGAGPRNSAALARLAARSDRRALRSAGDGLRGDRDFISAALAADGLQLEFAGDGLRNDPEIVLLAVRQNWRAFQFAGEALRRDADFVRAMLQQPGVDPEAFRFAAENLTGSSSYVHSIIACAYPGMYRHTWATHAGMEG